MTRCLPLLLLALSLSACRTSYPAQWTDSQVPSNSETLVYETLHFSLDKAGYPIGIGVDKGARMIETGWYTSLAPMKSKGFRQRAHVSYQPIEEGRYGVRVRVERETNESLRPLDMRFAKWESAPDNTREAQRITQIVRSYLARDEIDIGPSPGKAFD
jgi:hypothetical protein